MKSNIIKYSLWVIIMLAVISKALGFSKPQEAAPLMPRQIELSGNILHFSMPENFSPDMPADNMIESVDLADNSLYQRPEKYTLIRRWWDFRDSGLFSKEYGTSMMSIYIKKIPEHTDKDILQPLGLIATLIDDFKAQASSDDNGTYYPDFYEAYSSVLFNNQHWISYPIEKPSTNQHDIFYAIPLTAEHYIVVGFSFAPANNIPVRQFIEEHARAHMNAIMHSFNIQYIQNSQVPAVISQPVDLQKLIDDKFYPSK